MTNNFTTLSVSWTQFMTRSGVKGVSTSTDCADCQISFNSDDQSFHLRQEDDWWIIDVVNDRGRRYDDQARLSTFELAEKYLTSRWGSFMRIALGLELIEPRLVDQGFGSGVEVRSTADQWRTELISPAGRAILPSTRAVVFSHFMTKPLTEIQQIARDGTGLG